MRITFSTEEAAQAALDIWERHGFRATRSGAVVVTNCPALWAIPIIHRTIGFHQVERLVVIDSLTATERAPKVPAEEPQAQSANKAGVGWRSIASDSRPERGAEAVSDA